MKKAVLLVAVLMLSLSAWAGSTLYNQPFDQTGNVYASQNDTTGGNGLFAQVYDNFMLGASSTITEVQFVGGYWNGDPGGVTGWTVNFYADSEGMPGALLQTYHLDGLGGETYLGNFGGTPIYSYDITGLNFQALAGQQYWLDIYPDLGFPPQWGWASGTGGDGVAWQDFLGERSQVGADMAFTLIGNSTTGATPEPGTLVMFGTGMVGLAGFLRRKLF
jgi:hypothetical protein